MSLRSLTPSNDNFDNAELITEDQGCVIGNNHGATEETGEPDIDNRNGAKSIWYDWTAKRDGMVTFKTVGSKTVLGDQSLTTLDTALAVFEGTTLFNIVEKAKDTGVNDFSSTVTFSAVSNAKNEILVDGFNGETGIVSLCWRYVDMDFNTTKPLNDDFGQAIELSTESGKIGTLLAHREKLRNPFIIEKCKAHRFGTIGPLHVMES